MYSLSNTSFPLEEQRHTFLYEPAFLGFKINKNYRNKMALKDIQETKIIQSIIINSINSISLSFNNFFSTSTKFSGDVC